ncbi:hypothetical protein FACS1894126_0060 [Alphaproteobacteria bacterium]|nr:hypothetical protein FACS1894126_0060 [Alphaproteobacteria bacterium]
MCFPENDIPRDILRVELESSEIENIAATAYAAFNRKWKKTIADIVARNSYKSLGLDEHDWKKIESIADCNASSCIFCQGRLSKTISEIYLMLIKAEDHVKHIDDYGCINESLLKLSRLRDCVDLYLLWNLFDLTKNREALEYMSLETSVIFNYYAACCDVAIGKGIAKNLDTKKGLEMSRNFFLDAAKWISSRANEFPNCTKKKQYTKYEDIIQLLRRAIRRGRFHYL